MVCATNPVIMTHSDIEDQAFAKSNMVQQQQRQEFDMIMDDDDDSDDDEMSSQDEGITTNSSPTISSSSTTSSTKRISNQPLFLNFTSDLSPQKMSKKKPKPKKQTAYRVNGVNILNRNNLDSKTAIERIQRRRENHNHVERRRRDNINNIIFELSSVVPNATQPGQKPNKGNILKLTLDYIKDLQAENQVLKDRLNHPTTSSSSSVDENILLKSASNFSQSPSAPNSPTRFVRNVVIAAQSASVPSSPRQEDVNLQSVAVAPLTLPPQYQHHQHNSSFSSNSIILSSTPNSTHSSPVPTSAESSPSINHNNVIVGGGKGNITTNVYPSYHPYHQQQPIHHAFNNNTTNNNTSNHNSPSLPSAHVSIPQPPQFYNYQQYPVNHHETVQSNNNNKQTTPGLRPLLPATKNHYPLPQQQQQSFPPSLRMSGYEKIYGNVCRY